MSTDNLSPDFEKILVTISEALNKLSDGVLNFKFILPVVESLIKGYITDPTEDDAYLYEEEIEKYQEYYEMMMTECRNIEKITRHMVLVLKIVQTMQLNDLPELKQSINLLEKDPRRFFMGGGKEFEKSMLRLERKHDDLIKLIKQMRDVFKQASKIGNPSEDNQ
jgi:hypothetical protein